MALSRVYLHNVEKLFYNGARCKFSPMLLWPAACSGKLSDSGKYKVVVSSGTTGKLYHPMFLSSDRYQMPISR